MENQATALIFPPDLRLRPLPLGKKQWESNLTKREASPVKEPLAQPGECHRTLSAKVEEAMNAEALATRGKIKIASAQGN